MSDLQIEQWEHSCSLDHFRGVCPDCVGEPDLRAWAQSRLSRATCEFCGRESDEPIAADADDVLRFISTSLRLEYEQAVEALPHDLESPTGYYGNPMLTQDVFEDAEIELEAVPFAEFVWTAFRDAYWCERDPFASRPYEQTVVDWSAFRAYAQSAGAAFDPSAPLARWSEGDPSGRIAAGMLRHVGELVTQLDLTQTLDAGTQIARGRVHPPTATWTLAYDLGTPPPNVAGDGRMNTKATPIFYGARDPATARSEIVEPQHDSGKVITLGSFELTEQALLVDLNELPGYPGLLDEHRQSERQAILFLRAFRDDISASAVPNQDEHPEYRPTQIVAHYLITEVQSASGRAFVGIAYPSAKRSGAENVALWVAREDCIDPAASRTAGRTQLVLTSTRVQTI
jgi:RES domain-containing protein